MVRIHNCSPTLILEIPPQETNPKGTLERFMAATFINSKKLDTAQECNEGTGSASLMLSRKGKCMGDLSTWERTSRACCMKKEKKGLRGYLASNQAKLCTETGRLD